MSDKIPDDERRIYELAIPHQDEMFPHGQSDHDLAIFTGAFFRGFQSSKEELTRLRAQLQERDAQLAECVNALKSIALPPDALPTMRDNPRMVDNFWYPRSLARETIASLSATAQANAKIIEAAEEQERALYVSGTDAELRQHYLEACYRTDQAVRAKRELKQ